MSNYATATHQNLVVWARRLDIQINDLDQLARAADSLFGCSSRRAVLMVLATRLVSVAKGIPSNGSEAFTMGLTLGNLIYAQVYEARTGRSVENDFRQGLLRLTKDEGAIKARLTLEQVEPLILEYSSMVQDLVTKAVYSRNQERLQPSLVNVILQRAQGY